MAYKNLFQMPTPVKIIGRTTSITNSFINGIIPCIVPTEEEIKTVLEILGMDEHTIRCAYCGDKHTEWDHFRPLVKEKGATGYISEIHNLVPSCPKCNQSKGNSEWRKWIKGPAKLSPATRGVKDLETKIKFLEEFEKWGEPTKVDFEKIVGSAKWGQHWKNCSLLHEQMRDSQKLSDEIKDIIKSYLFKESQTEKNTNKPDDVTVISESSSQDSAQWADRQVGIIVQTTLRHFLENGEYDPISLSYLQDINYSKDTFKLNFSLLLKASTTEQCRTLGIDHTGVNRYYVNPLKINGEFYLLTSQWYDRNKPYLIRWLKRFQ